MIFNIVKMFTLNDGKLVLLLIAVFYVLFCIIKRAIFAVYYTVKNEEKTPMVEIMALLDEQKKYLKLLKKIQEKKKIKMGFKI